MAKRACRTRVRLAIGTAVAVVLAGGAAAAAAVSGLHYNQSPGTAAGRRTTFAHGRCKAGTKVVGGGATVAGGAHHAGAIVGIYPEDSSKDANKIPDNVWTSRVDTFGNASEPMTAFAICAAPAFATGITYAETHVPSIGYGEPEQTANCPPGTHVLGGGGFLSVSAAKAETEIIASRPVDGPDADKRPNDAWKYLAGVYGPGNLTYSTNAYAICAKPSNIHATITYRLKTGSVNEGAQGTISSPCFAGESVVGGGFVIHPDYLYGVPVNGDEPAGTSAWKVVVTNYNTSPKVGVTAWAVCAKARG